MCYKGYVTGNCYKSSYRKMEKTTGHLSTKNNSGIIFWSHCPSTNSITDYL